MLLKFGFAYVAQVCISLQSRNALRWYYFTTWSIICYKTLPKGGQAASSSRQPPVSIRPIHNTLCLPGFIFNEALCSPHHVNTLRGLNEVKAIKISHLFEAFLIFGFQQQKGNLSVVIANLNPSQTQSCQGNKIKITLMTPDGNNCHSGKEALGLKYSQLYGLKCTVIKNSQDTIKSLFIN